MNCEHGLELINARIDGELLPDDRHRLTAHLGECATCQSASDEMERADRDLARMFATRSRAASAVADQALEAWLAEAPPSRRRVHLGWVSAAAAGFAAAFLLYGPYAWNGAGTVDQHAHATAAVDATALVEEWKRSDAPQEVELRIRSLGSVCGDPLADAVKTWDGEANDDRRLGAARVLCDLADASQIPTLIELLDDPSPEIQTLSEASLVRLTGRQRDGLVPIDAQSAGTCANLQGDWREWWEQNKDKFKQPGE